MVSTSEAKSKADKGEAAAREIKVAADAAQAPEGLAAYLDIANQTQEGAVNHIAKYYGTMHSDSQAISKDSKPMIDIGLGATVMDPDEAAGMPKTKAFRRLKLLKAYAAVANDDPATHTCFWWKSYVSKYKQEQNVQRLLYNCTFIIQTHNPQRGKT